MPQGVFVRREPRASLPAKVSSTAHLYILHCAGCHGFDGAGQPQAGVPAMRGVVGYFMRSEEGRAFLVQVPGVNNAGLSDAQIAELTNWLVKTMAGPSLPARWRAFDAAELPALRAARPSDMAGARRRILADLRAAGVVMPD
ncbi:MAG: cytochrome C [Burkholderiaceae bacterium]|nr:cytochrome C [Burkholderiaceae bacterium]